MAIERRNFAEGADKAVTKELRAGTWWRCDGFKIAQGSDGTRCIRAPWRAWKQRVPEDEYQPLVAYRNLFLIFARLAEDKGLDGELDTDHNAAVALQWARDFGVLGFTPVTNRGAWWGDPRGGVGDSVAAFAAEAWIANKTLRLYEAATRPGELGGVHVETILSLAPHLYRGLHPDEARNWALDQAATNIQYRVARYAYPQLYQRRDHTFVEGYDFANLCGALWLRALWLLVADDVRRCEYPQCNRIIVYREPEPPPLNAPKGTRGKYRTRKDAEHCPEWTGRHCRVYHHREKRRQAARN